MSIADSSLHVMATLCHLSLPLYFLPPHPSPSNSTCLQSDFHSASIADFHPRALDRQSAWLLLFLSPWQMSITVPSLLRSNPFPSNRHSWLSPPCFPQIMMEPCFLPPEISRTNPLA